MSLTYKCPENTFKIPFHLSASTQPIVSIAIPSTLGQAVPSLALNVKLHSSPLCHKLQNFPRNDSIGSGGLGDDSVITKHTDNLSKYSGSLKNQVTMEINVWAGWWLAAN